MRPKRVLPHLDGVFGLKVGALAPFNEQGRRLHRRTKDRGGAREAIFDKKSGELAGDLVEAKLARSLVGLGVVAGGHVQVRAQRVAFRQRGRGWLAVEIGVLEHLDEDLLELLGAQYSGLWRGGAVSRRRQFVGQIPAQ